MKILSSKEFENKIKENKTVLVDFFASWCGPCRMIAPILEQVSAELKSDEEICKIDVDQSNDISAKYNVFSVPTLILFKNGQEVHRIVGLRNKEQILELFRNS